MLLDGRVVIGMNDKTLRGLDAATGQRLKTLQELPDEICRKIKFSDGVTLSDRRAIRRDDSITLTVREKRKEGDAEIWKDIDTFKVTEIDVSRMYFSQAILEGDLPEMLWHNGATISQADYDRWVKPRKRKKEQSEEEQDEEEQDEEEQNEEEQNEEEQSE